MKKPVLGLDFDDVLMDFRSTLDEYHNEKHGTNLTREGAVSYSLPDSWDCSEDEAAKRVVGFYESDHHHAALPVDMAQEAITKLARKHDFVIITSRPEFIKDRTLEWLEKNYPNTFQNICFTNLYLGEAGAKKRTKAEVCAEYGVKVFVDDNLDNAQDVAEKGFSVLLLDKPWNQVTDLHPNITRVYSWDDIVRVLD
jgi:uncharacterized HAD superfamily protein